MAIRVSGAPLTNTRIVSSCRWNEAAYRRSGSYGIRATKGYRCRISLATVPPLCAAASSATSTLSPVPVQPSRSLDSWASFGSAAALSRAATRVLASWSVVPAARIVQLSRSCPTSQQNAVPSGSRISVTTSSFMVRVPVLSVAIMVQDPSDSTAGILRTITWAFAIRRMLIASATEMATGSPSGIALTASPTDIMNSSRNAMPRSIPTNTSNATATPTATAISREKRWSLRIKGGCEMDSRPSSRAIRPICVAAPVATTMPWPLPRSTTVPAEVRHWRALAGALLASHAESLRTGSDSPVSRDSSHCRSMAEVSSRSAGTRLPASSTTRSPGTSVLASISCWMPSRITVARGCSILRSATAALSAVCSCAVPMTPLISSTAPMNSASFRSPNASDTAAAARRM
ncbi:hypothetical protein D3C72_1185120 [compost metagenome]